MNYNIVSSDDMRQQLVAKYVEWLKALKEDKRFDFTDHNKYSNPYLCDIPQSWENSSIRLMVCGREGNGEISKDDNGTVIAFPEDISSDDVLKEYINELQENNSGYVNGKREWSFFNDHHAFAKTILKFIERFPTIWNECDKICHVDNEGYHATNALTSGENTTLHSIGNMDILKEEIMILKPTHIVFLGYWRQSLGIGKKSKNNIRSIHPTFDFPKDKSYDTGEVAKLKINEDNIINIYYFSHPQFKGGDYQNTIDEVIGKIYEDEIKNNFLDEKDYDDEE